MSDVTLDLDALVAALAEDSPCGPSLEYDQQCLTLIQDAQGTSEREVGTSFVPAEPPNWKDIRERCLTLLAKSRDLRLMALLTSAQVSTHGFAGLRDGLCLIRQTLEEHWESVHPQLDPEDDNDPTMRMNVLADLTPEPGTGSATIHMVKRVRDVPLTESRVLGRFSLRDIAIAKGEAPAPVGRDGEAEPAPDMGQVESAFQDTSIEALQAIHEAVHSALDELKGLDAQIVQRVGSVAKVEFKPLHNVLVEVCSVLDEQMARRGFGDSADEAGEPISNGKPVSTSGEVRTRDDVLKTLDRVLRYYETSEPSSPVPLLLRRAKKLVHMSFDQIVQDMAPDAVSTIRTISGDREE